MKKFFMFAYLTVPCILVSVPYWTEVVNDSFGVYVAFVYIITIIGVVIFFKFNFCKYYILPLGLLLSLFAPFVMTVWGYVESTFRLDGYYAALWQLNLIFLIVCSVFYVVPFVLLSLAIRKMDVSV